MPFLLFSDERVAAATTGQESSELETMPLSAWIHLPRQHGLRSVEDGLGHQGFMDAHKALAGLSDADYANVKRIVEHGGESVASDPAASFVTEAIHKKWQRMFGS